jgi:hypothetical protein
MTDAQLAVTGIDVSGRIIDLGQLEQDLTIGGVPVPNGLTVVGPSLSVPPIPVPPPPGLQPFVDGSKLFTYDGNGDPTDLPPEAVPIVNAYTYEPPS